MTRAIPLSRVSRTSVLLMTAMLASTVTSDAGEEPGVRFEHHFVTRSMPGDITWGYGTPGLADFDRDGDLDYAFGVRGDKIYWFEFNGPDTWKRHELGPLPSRTLGATTLDVDGDGWTDLVTGGFWYRNSARPRTDAFEIHRYDGATDSEVHDVVAADVDGDGRKDIIVLGDGLGCFWYRIPEGRERVGAWPRVTITLAVRKTEDAIHSGFFPRGVRDLDRDGDADIVLPDRWLENTEHGRKWIRHALPFGQRGPWGLSSRSWIVDLDRDGDQDIVIVDSDQKRSRAAWLESDGRTPPSFSRHLLPLTAPGTRGSFHSLAVADFDGDGDLDVFTAEQEDSSILPEGAPPRWYVWENLDGRAGRFKERIVLDARLGGHDALVGDVDGDGDLDLCAKIWKRWPGNSNDGVEHATFLENLAR